MEATQQANIVSGVELEPDVRSEEQASARVAITALEGAGRNGSKATIPSPAQYLLRFDDLCPTISPERWQRFLRLIEEYKICPILAVVPENEDYDLQYSHPDPEFWDNMCRMEAAGATIGLNGYRHLCVSRGRSMVPLHRHTEFAGVPEQTQRQWIHMGLRILRSYGLNPRIWVAPRHGFDRATLRVLHKEGIGLVSDGFARTPFIRGGHIWIPQQLWAPEPKASGLWTICMHCNSTSNSLVDQLRAFLDLYAGQFTSVDRILTEYQPAKVSPVERLYEAYALLRAQKSKIRKKRPRPYRPS